MSSLHAKAVVDQSRGANLEACRWAHRSVRSLALMSVGWMGPASRHGVTCDAGCHVRVHAGMALALHGATGSWLKCRPACTLTCLHAVGVTRHAQPGRHGVVSVARRGGTQQGGGEQAERHGSLEQRGGDSPGEEAR